MEIGPKLNEVLTRITEKFDQLDFFYLLNFDKNYELKVRDSNRGIVYSGIKPLIMENFLKKENNKFEFLYQEEKNYTYVVQICDEFLLAISCNTLHAQPTYLKLMIKKIVDDLEKSDFLSEESLQSRHTMSKHDMSGHDDISCAMTAGVRIQKDILGSFSEFQKYIPESFIIFSPKDSISGDFYWVKKIGNCVIIVLGDCTGHGMEGGLMTVMGVSLLKVLVNKMNVKLPNTILELLHSHIMDMGESDIKTLGMEMGICVIDLDDNSIIYSGANINLQSITNGKLDIYKANRFTVGSDFHENIEINSVKIDNIQGSHFFMYTDGIVDQMGSNKKLGKRAFFEIIEKAQNVEDKKSFIENELNIWKGSMEQTDDMTLIYFKI